MDRSLGTHGGWQNWVFYTLRRWAFYAPNRNLFTGLFSQHRSKWPCGEVSSAISRADQIKKLRCYVRPFWKSKSRENPDLLKAATILFAAKPAPLTKHTTKAWLCAFHFQCETIWYDRGILGACKTRTQVVLHNRRKVIRWRWTFSYALYYSSTYLGSSHSSSHKTSPRQQEEADWSLKSLELSKS